MTSPHGEYRVVQALVQQHGTYLSYVNAAAEQSRITEQIARNGLGLQPSEYLTVGSIAVQSPHTNVVNFGGQNFRVELGSDITLDDRLYSTVVEIKVEPAGTQPN